MNITGALDVFNIGRTTYTDGNYQKTVGWMLEALRLVNSKTGDQQQTEELPSKVEILDHLAWSEFKVRITHVLKNKNLYFYDCLSKAFFSSTHKVCLSVVTTTASYAAACSNALYQLGV